MFAQLLGIIPVAAAASFLRSCDCQCILPAVAGQLFSCMSQVLDDSYRKALALPVDRFATSFNLAAHSSILPVREESLALLLFTQCFVSPELAW